MENLQNTQTPQVIKAPITPVPNALGKDVKLSEEERLNTLAKAVNPVFKPFGDQDKVKTKQVYFNGETTVMPYYSRKEDNYDYAYDQENNRVLKYTGKEWEFAGEPTQYDKNYYKSKSELNQNPYLEKNIKKTVEAYDPNHPYFSSPNNATNPFVQQYTKAREEGKVQTITPNFEAHNIVERALSEVFDPIFNASTPEKQTLKNKKFETWEMNGETYGLDRESRSVYKHLKQDKNGKELGWEKVKDISDLDMLETFDKPKALTGNGNTTAKLASANLPWFQKEIYSKVGTGTPDQVAPLARKNMADLYKSSPDKNTLIQQASKLSGNDLEAFLDNPINTVKILTDNKTLIDDNSIADAIEYAGFLQAQGERVVALSYTNPVTKQPQIQESWGALKEKAKDIINQVNPSFLSRVTSGYNAIRNPVMTPELSEELQKNGGRGQEAADWLLKHGGSSRAPAIQVDPSLNFMYGVIDYTGDKRRIDINNQSVIDPKTVEKVSTFYEKYSKANEKTNQLVVQYDVLKKRYEQSHKEEDYKAVKDLENLINSRVAEIKKIAPTEEENNAFQDYSKILNDARDNYISINSLLKTNYKASYDYDAKKAQTKKDIVAFDKAHPYAGSFNHLAQNIQFGANGAFLSLITVPARYLSDREKYDAYDVFADGMEAQLKNAHELYDNNDPKASRAIRVSQSIGNSIGMMLPSLLLAPISGGESLLAQIGSRSMQFATTYASVFQEYYDKGLAQKMSQDETMSFATISAAINALFEVVIPVERVYNPKGWMKMFDIGASDYIKLLANSENKFVMKLPAYKELFMQRLEQSIGESGEEFLQNWSDYYIQRQYNAEKLTNFEYEKNNGDFLDTILSVVGTTLLMGAPADLQTLNKTNQNYIKDAKEFLPRNFEKFAESLKALKEKGSITEEQYKEQLNSIGDIHALLNTENKYSDFNKSLSEFGDKKLLTPEQKNDLISKRSQYIWALNNLNPEERQAFKKLDGVVEKTEYLNNLIETNPEGFGVKSGLNTALTEQEVKKYIPILEQLHESLKSGDKETLGILLQNPGTLNTLSLVMNDSFLVERKDDQKEIDLKKLKTSLDSFFKDKQEIKDPAIVVDPFITGPVQQTPPPIQQPQLNQTPVVVATTLKPIEEQLNEKSFEELEDIYADNSINKFDEFLNLQYGPEYVENSKKVDNNGETMYDTITRTIEDKFHEYYDKAKKKQKEVPVVSEEEEKDITDDLEDDGYEIYQNKHTGDVKITPKLIAKKGDNFFEIDVNEKGQVNLTAITKEEAEKNGQLIPHQNNFESKATGAKERINPQYPQVELKFTNYTGFTPEENRKKDEIISNFLLDPNTTQESLNSSITVQVGDNIAKGLNEKFLSNENLSVEKLIKLGFILFSNDKKQALKIPGNKIIAIRRNTKKDIFFKFKIQKPNSQEREEITKEINFADRFIVIENVNGKLVSTPFTFEGKTLEEVNKLFASWEGKNLTEVELKNLKRQEEISKQIYSILEVNKSLTLSQIPLIRTIITHSGIVNVPKADGMLLSEAVKAYPNIWENPIYDAEGNFVKNEGLLVWFDTPLSSNVYTVNKNRTKEPAEGINKGYFAEITKPDGSRMLIRLYPNSPISPETKIKIEEALAKYNSILNDDKILNKTEQIRDVVIKQLNSLAFIRHGVYSFEFELDNNNNLKLKVSRQETKDSVSRITIFKNVESSKKLKNLTDIINSFNSDTNVKNKKYELDENNFVEQMPPPSTKVTLSDEEIMSKFTISTEPYVFGLKVSIDINDSQIKAITPPVLKPTISAPIEKESSGGVGGDVVEPKSYAEATDAYKATELGSSEDAKNKKQALVEQAETEEGKKFVESEVSKLEKNDDGTITVFRSGTLQEGHNPATTSRKTAEIIAAERKKQGLSSDIVEVRVNPSDISVVVKGIESEVFVKVGKNNKERIEQNTTQKQKSKTELLSEKDEVQNELEKTRKALIDSEKAFSDGTYPFSENVFKDANKKQKLKIKNLEWQLSKIEQSLKETPKTDSVDVGGGVGSKLKELDKQEELALNRPYKQLTNDAEKTREYNRVSGDFPKVRELVNKYIDWHKKFDNATRDEQDNLISEGGDIKSEMDKLTAISDRFADRIDTDIYKNDKYDYEGVRNKYLDEYSEQNRHENKVKQEFSEKRKAVEQPLEETLEVSTLEKEINDLKNELKVAETTARTAEDFQKISDLNEKLIILENNKSDGIARLDDSSETEIISQEEIDTIISELPSSISVEINQVFSNLKSGGIPIGYFIHNAIKLAKNAKKGTGFHEQFHAVFRALLSDKEITKFLGLAKANILALDKNYFSAENIEKFILLRGYDVTNAEAIDLMTEEWMADDYMEYRKNNPIKAAKYSLKGLYERLKRFLQGFTNNGKIKNLYAKIKFGEFAESPIKNNKFKNIGIPLYTVLEGFNKLLGGNYRSEQLIKLITAKVINKLAEKRVALNDPDERLVYNKERIEEAIEEVISFIKQQENLLFGSTLPNQEKLAAIEKNKLLKAVLNKEMAKGRNREIITSEVLKNVSKIRYKANDIETDDDFLLQESENETGSGSFDRELNEINTSYSKLGAEIKGFFDSIIYLEKDEYGQLVEKVVDGTNLYNYLLRVSNKYDRYTIFEKIKELADDDVVLNSFMEKFVEYTGYNDNTKESFNDYSLNNILVTGTNNLAGQSFFHKFITALEKEKTNHSIVVIKKEGGISIVEANNNNPQNFTFQEWNKNYFKIIAYGQFSTLENRKKLAKTISLMTNMGLYTNPNTSQKKIKELQNLLSSIGIKVSYSYLHYSLTDQEESIPDIPKLDESFIDSLSHALENDGLFSGVQEQDIEARLKNIAKGNAFFDTNVFESSYKTADGKVRYSYVLPNFIYTKSKKLRNKFGMFQNWIGNKELTSENATKLEVINSYKNNPYFKNNPLFSNLFTAEEIGKNFSGLDIVISGGITNQKDPDSAVGIESKDTDPKALLVTMINLFSDISEAKKTGGVALTKIWTQILESSSTLLTVVLPIKNNLYNATTGFNSEVKDTLWGMFNQEVSRINGEFHVDAENNIVEKGTLDSVNLKDISQNKLFANFKFLNDYLIEQGILKVETNESGKITSSSIDINKLEKQEEIIKEKIKAHHEYELEEFFKNLINLDVVSNYNTEGQKFTSKYFNKQKDLKFKNIQEMLGNFYINSFLMSAGFNQLMYGDLSISKDDGDAVKRYKGPAGFGPSHSGLEIKTLLTTPAKVDRGEYKDIDSNDGQGSITAKFAMIKAWRMGQIDSQDSLTLWRKLIDGVKDPKEFQELQKEYGFNLVDLIKNTKTLAYDAQSYIKDSETVLFKNWTSYWDERQQKWLAIEGMEKSHNLREYMENPAHPFDLQIPTSASKRVQVSTPVDHNFFENANFNNSIVHKGHIINGENYRLQVETESHGWDKISFASQLFYISQSELPEKYDKLKERLNEVLSSMKTQNAKKAFAELEKEILEENKTSRDIAGWIEKVRESSLKNTPNVVLDEMLRVSSTGDIEYDFNVPSVIKKLIPYFLKGFTRANSPKLTGRSLILKSQDGYNLIVKSITDKITGKKTEEIVKREDYLNDPFKTGYSSRKLKVHTFEDGRPSWGEIVMTRGAADRYGLKIGDKIPEELLKGLGIRIPTQSHHSVTFFKVVDFLPEMMGDTVIAPDEIIALAGSDFDVDKLITLLKAFYKDKNNEVVVYGKANTAEERYEEYIEWVKRNDPFVKSYIQQNLVNNFSYKQIKTKVNALRKELRTIREESRPIKNEIDLLSIRVANIDKTIRDLRKQKDIDVVKSRIEDNLLDRKKLVNIIEDLKKDIVDKLNKNQKTLDVEVEKLERIKRLVYNEALNSEEVELYKLEDFEKDPNLKNLSALNNDFLDVMTELLTAPELAESYKTPATMDVIKEQGKQLYELAGYSYNTFLGNSINGLLEAWNNNRAGKDLVGPHAFSNIVGIYLEKNNVPLVTTKGGNNMYGVMLDGVLHNNFKGPNGDFTENDIKINFKELKKSIEKGEIGDSSSWFTPIVRRINDSISSFVSAATDNAKELGMKTLNHTKDTAGIWSIGVKLGMGQTKMNLMSISPIIVDLIKQFESKNTYLDPTEKSVDAIIKNNRDVLGKFLGYENDIISESEKGVSSEELIKAILYDRIIESGVQLTREEDYERNHINLRIIGTFLKLKYLSDYAIKLGTVLSTNKEIKSDFETYEKILQSYEELLSEDSPFNIKSTFEKDKNLQQNLATLKSALKLASKFFLQKTKFVQDGTKEILSGVNVFSANRAKPIIEKLYSSFLSIKALQFIRGKELYNSYGDLVLEGPKNITTKLEEAINKYPDLINNMFIKHLKEKIVENEPKKLITVTNINSNHFTEQMIDSFKLLFNSEIQEIKDFAKDLVSYLIFKDNLDFKFFSYVSYIDPGQFHEMAQLTKQMNIGLFKGQPLKDFIGVTEEEAQMMFYSLFGRSERYTKLLNSVSLLEEDGDTFLLDSFTRKKIKTAIKDKNPEGKETFTTVFRYKREDDTFTFKTDSTIPKSFIGKNKFLFPIQKDERPLATFIHPPVINLEKDYVLVRTSLTKLRNDIISTYEIKPIFYNDFMSSISAFEEWFEENTMEKDKKYNLDDRLYDGDSAEPNDEEDTNITSQENVNKKIEKSNQPINKPVSEKGLYEVISKFTRQSDLSKLTEEDKAIIEINVLNKLGMTNPLKSYSLEEIQKALITINNSVVLPLKTEQNTLSLSKIPKFTSLSEEEKKEVEELKKFCK